MSRIAQQDIDAILKQTDIADVISHYLPIEKKGKDYVGVCPFHADHDPSLRISSAKGIYKCFACGAGGNVFTFLQKMDGLTFPEAVRKTAQMIHYPLPEFDDKPKKDNPHQPLLDALDLYTRYCAYELESQDGIAAKAYLKERQFSKDLIARFSIGYAPDSGMSIGYMQDQGMASKDLVESGIARWQDNGLYAVFQNRIMIPIADPEGKVVGFTARILPGSPEKAKYINTAATPLYDKGKLIFNYHRARHAARKAGRVILTEGAMDVLGLEKAGIQEGIACLGTAITPYQISLLKNLRVPVTVFYDADSAGQNAVWKFGRLAMEQGLPFSVVSSHDQKDPDEIFCSQGKEALLQCVSKTVSFVEFAFTYLQSQYDLSNYEDRKTFALEIRKLIERTLEPFEQAAWFEKLEEQTGFSFAASQQEFNPAGPTPKPRYRTNHTQNHLQERIQHPAAVKPAPGRKTAERMILWTMLYSRDYAERFSRDLGALSPGPFQTLYLYIRQAYKHTESLQLDLIGLYHAIEEPECRDLLVEITEMPDQSEIAEEQYASSLYSLRKFMLDEQIASLEKQIKQAEASHDLSKAIELSSLRRKVNAERRLLFEQRKKKNRAAD